jgi:ClpP class serine protease
MGLMIEPRTSPTSSTRRASVFDLAASQPWAIQPAMLETIAAIARRENESVEAVEARLGRKLQNTRQVVLRDRAAIIPIVGPVFRYANLFTDISGATSLDVLARDFTAAVESPEVKTIILAIDSPGGQANGIAEMAAMIRAAEKDVIAYVDGTAASAAYWLASAADRVVLSKTAMVGSIGAVLSLSTAKDKNTVEIVSSQSPNKRPDVTTDQGRGQIQQLIDALAQVFVDDVAAYRKTSVDTVLARFGQGAMFIAADALSRGMADEISTLETLIAGLSGKTATKGDTFMAQDNGTPAAASPVMDRAALAAQHPELFAAMLAEGAAAERARIQDVQAQAQGFPGHDDLLAEMIADGKTTGPQAAVRILAAERAQGADRLKALYADAPAPLPHTVAPEDAADAPDAAAPVEDRAKAAWDKDPALRSEFSSLGAYTAYLKNHEAGRARVLGH